MKNIKQYSKKGENIKTKSKCLFLIILVLFLVIPQVTANENIKNTISPINYENSYNLNTNMEIANSKSNNYQINKINENNESNSNLNYNNKINENNEIKSDNISKYISINSNNSIQEIINNANDNDIINLEKGIYNQSNIIINKNISLQGTGLPNETIINGESLNSIFQINSKYTVNFINLMFINGNSENGGAINNNASGTLSISNCIFQNNHAEKNGGAINTYNGILTIANSKFINNSANYDGGAVAIQRFSKSTITNSSFFNNSAKEWGGGLYNWLTNTEVENSTFNNNYANFGAGIINSGKLKITNSKIINNHASSLGGAIYNYNDTVIINLTEILNNTANLHGNDIYIDKSSNESNFNDNWWGINNPLTTNNYLINWSSRYYDLFNLTKTLDSWLNLNANIENNTSNNSYLIANLKSTNSNKTTSLNLPLSLTIANSTYINYLNNGTAIFDLINPNIELNISMDYQNILLNQNNITKTHLNVNNFNESFGANKNFTASLKDNEGNPISGKDIKFILYNALGESKSYWRTTNTEGIAKLPIYLNPNNFTMLAIFEGDETYSGSISQIANITINNNNNTTDATIKTIITANNFTENYGEIKNFTAILTNKNNTAIAGKEISLKLTNILGESKIYWRTTNTEGIAKLQITLIPGTWTITAYYPGDELYQESNNSTGTLKIRNL